MLIIDMDALANVVRRAGTTAHVEQTGGGVATLFAGPERPHEHDQGAVRFAAVAGPGAYGWGARPSVAYPDEFCVGPDDDGDATPVRLRDLGDLDLSGIARLIVAQAQQDDPTLALSLEALRARGLSLH